MRAVRFVAVMISAVALLAVPASAKEGVHAKLDGPVRLAATAGKTIKISWRLVDADGHGFGASGIYLRVSRCSGVPRQVEARDLGGGRFSSRLVVPKGGIRALRVGLVGWRIAGGRTRRADRLFEFDPPLVRRC